MNDSDEYTLAELLPDLGLQTQIALPQRAPVRTDSGAADDLPYDGRIRTGQRNATLTSLAGSMHRRGINPDAIELALLKVNEQQVDEPLPDDEVRAIVSRISRYANAPPEIVIQSLNDKSNGDRLVELHGQDIRYVKEWKRWINWNGRYWELDDADRARELAKQTATTIFALAAATVNPDLQKLVAKHAQASHQLPKLKAMVEVAKSVPSIVVSALDLDRDDWLIGVENGTIELRTGQFREHRREDMMTRHAPVRYDPDAQCPTWCRFLDRVTKNDPELIYYLQRIFGYCLTGTAQERVLFFLYGNGANGKSTFLSVLRELLGPDYAKQTQYETLVAQKFGRSATNDLARLQGARVTLASEIEDGRQLDESLVKQMTGGTDQISARYLYAEHVDFTPKFKLLMAGNHKPIIRGCDDAIWDRLHIVHFTETIPENERDHQLLDKLLAELSGILNFALKGCLDWCRGGLHAPDLVKQAVAEYRSDSDLIGQWIDQCCVRCSSISASDAYDSYRKWAVENGLRPMSNTSFGRKLSERFKKRRTASANIYVGLTLKEMKHQMEHHLANEDLMVPFMEEARARDRADLDRASAKKRSD